MNPDSDSNLCLILQEGIGKHATIYLAVALGALGAFSSWCGLLSGEGKG